MKNYTLTFLILLIIVPLFNCCEKQSGIGQFDNVIVENENNPNKFKQITFIVSLQNSHYGYLNIGIIDSLKIHVNGKYWGTFSSEVADTSGNTDRIVNNIKYSDRILSYLFIAPFQLKTDNLETAGDFVNYLNDRIVLTPGDYICEIKEIKYKNIQGDWIIKKVQVYSNLRVIENTTSSYIGNLLISIN